MPDGTGRRVEMRLWIDAPGATRQQLQAGIDALAELYRAAGADPCDCAEAADTIEHADILESFDETRARGDWAAAAWKAKDVALKAVFGFDPTDDVQDADSFDGPGRTGPYVQPPALEVRIDVFKPGFPADMPAIAFTTRL